MAENKIVHDAEYYILYEQHGERWEVEDKDLDARLAELREKHVHHRTSCTSCGTIWRLVMPVFLWSTLCEVTIRQIVIAWPRRESCSAGCTLNQRVRLAEQL